MDAASHQEGGLGQSQEGWACDPQEECKHMINPSSSPGLPEARSIEENLRSLLMTDKIQEELQFNGELVEKILSAVCSDLAPSIQDGSLAVQLLRLFETPKESADRQEAN